jgi:hypothetical protein
MTLFPKSDSLKRMPVMSDVQDRQPMTQRCRTSVVRYPHFNAESAREGSPARTVVEF